MSNPAHPKSIDDLLQFRLTEGVLQRLRSLHPDLYREHHEALEAEVGDESSLQRLDLAVTTVVDAIREGLQSAPPVTEAGKRKQLKRLAKQLNEERDEIVDDAEYRRSERYRQMKRVEAWVSPWIGEFRQHPEFQDVVIGMHDTELCPFLTGRVDDEAVLARLRAFLDRKSPPEDLMLKILTQPKD